MEPIDMGKKNGKQHGEFLKFDMWHESILEATSDMAIQMTRDIS